MSKFHLRSAAISMCATLALLSFSENAFAQKSTFYLDRLQMAGAPDDGLGVWRPQMGEKTRFYGQLGFGLSVNPYRVENYIDTDDQSKIVEEQNGAPVAMQLVTYVNAGVEILERFSFQISFPLAVYQDVNSLVNTDARIREEVDQKEIAPMDLRLDGRVVFLRNEEKSLKLGAIATLWFPTGNEYTFGGDTSITGALGIAAEYDAKLFAITLNAGYHFRPTARLNEFKLADELMLGLGAYAPLWDNRFRIGVEGTGSIGIGNDTTGDVDNSPLEARVDARVNLGDNPSQGWVGISAGPRLTAGYAPDFRAVAVVGGWFPVVNTKPKQVDFQYVIPGDADKDKLPDDIDMCPTAKEDGKGPNPDDGCPESLNDADSDGVLDAEDACPHEPGPRSQDPKKNGCPEFIRRAKGSELIEVLQEVQFAFDRADLLPPAFPILNEIVRLLKVNPDIELIRIEGHTDDVGSLKYNDDLSQSRAEAVVRYLTERGIAAERLTAQGFGKRRPLVENTTPEGRQKNRRVELHIVKQSGKVLEEGGTKEIPLKSSDTVNPADPSKPTNSAKPAATPAPDTKPPATPAPDTKPPAKP